MKQRWYDTDPTLSLVVSLLRNATQVERNTCAKYIVNYCQKRGYVPDNNVIKKIEVFVRRWYDKEKALSEALEYLKKISNKEKKVIVNKVIQLLQN